MPNDKPQASNVPGSSARKLQSRSMAPVRLPSATADLVNRMLAARCGAHR